MIDELLDPRAAGAILANLGQLFLVSAGLAVMFSFHWFALRLFAVGIFLALTAVVVPSALA
jgi:hypothetical protein